MRWTTDTSLKSAFLLLFFIFCKVSFVTAQLSDPVSAENLTDPVVQGGAPGEEDEAPESGNNGVQWKPSVEFSQRFDSGIEGVELAQVDFGGYGDMIYTRTEMKAQFSGIFQNGLILTPWFKDRLEVRANFREDDPPADTEDTVDVRLRNRFYIGFNVGYHFKDFLFGLDQELRVSNDLKPGEISRETIIRYAPVVLFSGSHEFGLSWSFEQLHGVLFNTSGFYQVDIDGKLKLQYLFYSEGDWKAGLFLQDDYRWKRETAEDVEKENELQAGVMFAFKNLRPSLGYYRWSDHESGSAKFHRLHGIRLGLILADKIYTFDIRYTAAFDLPGERGWQHLLYGKMKIKLK